MMDQTAFSDRLRFLRMEKNWTPEECAKLLDIHRSTIVRYEKGDRFPNFQGLIRIAKLFSVSTDFLLGVTDRRDHQAPTGVTGQITADVFQLKDGILNKFSNQPFLDFKKESELVFVRIDGQDYLPKFSPRDLLVFKRDILPKNGDIILWNRHEKIELRTFYKRNNGTILVGIAPYAPPEWIENWKQSDLAGILTHVIHGVTKP